MQRKDFNNKEHMGIRSSRTFKEDDSWFFKTREGELAGPFRDELEASTRLEVYIRLVNTGLQAGSGVLSS
jgi:hypothetical protein